MATALLLIIAVLLLVYAVPQLAPGWPATWDALRRRLLLPSWPRGSTLPRAAAPREETATATARHTAQRAAPAQPWLHIATGTRARVLVAGLALSVALQVWLTYHPTWFALALAPLCACAILAAAVLPAPLPWDGSVTPRTVAPRPWMPVGAAAIGLVCALVGVARVAADPWAAQDWWLAAMLIPILGLAVPPLAAQFGSARPRRAVDWREAGVPAGIFAFALGVRLPALDLSPPFVHGDAAMGGIWGRLFNSGRVPLLSIGWHGLPMASYAVAGLGLRLFGDTSMGLRLMNVVIGSASVVLLYLLGRELFDRRAALLAALVLAVSFLDVDLSRSGLHDIQGPACITLTLWLGARWLRRGGALTALLAGMSVALDLQMHWDARVAPLLLLGLLLFVAVREPELWARRWRETAWIALGAIVSCAPVLAMFMANPGSLAGRDATISILNPSTAAHIQSVYGTTAPPVVLANQIWRTWSTFYVLGDASTLINWPGGMFDTVSAALLAPALALALKRWKRWPYALCAAWFLAVVGASVLTIDPPWWPRLAALVPAAALCIGVLLSESARLVQAAFTLPARRTLAAVGLVLLCIAAGSLRIVYHDYPLVERQDALMEGTLVARFLATAPGAQSTVLVSDGHLYMDAPQIRFLAPRAAGCTLLPGEPLQGCAQARDSHLFVLVPERLSDLPSLERQRPGGHAVEVGTYDYGASRIMAYELPARTSVVSSQ